MSGRRSHANTLLTQNEEHQSSRSQPAQRVRVLRLASVPGVPRSVRIFIMLMRKTFEASSGKAWDDSSRERRTVVAQYLAHIPWSRCHAVIF